MLRGVEVTVGHEQEEGGKWPYAGTAEAIKALGAKHCVKGVTISFPSGQPGWHGVGALWLLGRLRQTALLTRTALWGSGGVR